MIPLAENDLKALFQRMRTYRIAYWIYAASAILYGAAAAALSLQSERPVPLLGDGVMAYGVLVAAAVIAGRWAAFRPRVLKARKIETLEAMVRHVFFTFLLLLAVSESMGLAAVAGASFGASPAWKPVALCFWQLLVSVLMTPDRSTWDRLLTRWDSTFEKGGFGDDT